MSQREEALKFETGRIKALQDERVLIQKETFTKWVNSVLAVDTNSAPVEVLTDLFADLADGRVLLKLLENLSGEKLGTPNSGRMRVHKIENVNKSLHFLYTKVRLESVGAEDIVDGNPRLILGLIWTLISRFHIERIEVWVYEDEEHTWRSWKASGKDALLLWCKRKTAGYAHVSIQDFTASWRTGMAFNALIHAHRPDLIEYAELSPSNHIDNLNNAFHVAEWGLGIRRLVDAQDVDSQRPDERSILTYVASYFHAFERMKNQNHPDHDEAQNEGAVAVVRLGHNSGHEISQPLPLSMPTASSKENVYENFVQPVTATHAPSGPSAPHALPPLDIDEAPTSCGICFERKQNMAFLCGHLACDVCAPSLVLCHICRQPIAQRIKLYL